MRSWMKLISEAYSELWEMIIRPPRDVYKVEELGPREFTYDSVDFEREDLRLKNDRGHALECSHFRPRGSSRLPCVVYCHGNSSCRLEAFDAMEVLLKRNITVFCFDFSGSGLSEGEYISLGHHEQRDLRTVVEYLRGLDSVSAVAVWGRSMGAATTVLRAAEDPNLAACVLDSPFSSLQQVAEELVYGNRIRVPRFLLHKVIGVVSKEVQKRAGFRIEELLPIKRAPEARSPALFAAAADDELVLPHHAADLHDAWGGHVRRLITFRGGHNGTRPDGFLAEAARFLEEHLRAASNLQVAAQNRPPAPRTPARPPAEEAAGERPEDHAELVPEQAAEALPAASGARSASIAEDLVAMGFDPDVAAAAMRRHSSVEAALEWIMRQSAQACAATLTSTLSRTSSTNRDASGGFRGSARGAQARGAQARGAQARGAEARPPLAQQLAELGFPPAEAREAARRCSSVEAAVEWLAASGGA